MHVLITFSISVYSVLSVHLLVQWPYFKMHYACTLTEWMCFARNNSSKVTLMTDYDESRIRLNCSILIEDNKCLANLAKLGILFKGCQFTSLKEKLRPRTRRET